MKVLITGARGQLGRCLQDILRTPDRQVMGLATEQLDIRDRKAVMSAVSSYKPDVLINAAAYTAVDKAESEPLLARAVNGQGPMHLAEACASERIPLVQVSTDYVFDGQKDTPYAPADKTHPTSEYGSSKLAGETAVSESGASYIIVRTAWVFSEYGSNFLKTMLRLATERDEISVVADQFGSPTYAGDLARAIAQALSQLIGKDWAGLYHFAGDPSCTWHEFAVHIFNEAVALGMLKRMPTVTPISSSDFQSRVTRPKNSILDSSEFLRDFQMEPADWRPAVTKVLKSLHHRHADRVT